jgi:hypothetical protein
MDDPFRYLVPLAIDEHVLVRDTALLGFLIDDLHQSVVRLPRLSDIDHFHSVLQKPLFGLKLRGHRSVGASCDDRWTYHHLRSMIRTHPFALRCGHDCSRRFQAV